MITMLPHTAPVDAPPPTSFLSLPYELREPIYRLILRSLPRVRPVLSSPTIPMYSLENLDPQPFFVHPQIKHDIEQLLASHTRIELSGRFDVLGASTQQWLRESSIEFKRIRICSPFPVPIVLDMNVLVDGEVVVHYKWRWTAARRQLYSWGRSILAPRLPFISEYMAEGLRKRVGARGGKGVGIEEINFLMDSMYRFGNWFHVHRRFRNSYFSSVWKSSSRLPAASYEEELTGLQYRGVESKEDFRRALEWWDDVEAEVEDLDITDQKPHTNRFSAYLARSTHLPTT
jgi:hypothetical protein